tara:strand:+ start:352 stop:2682 length:2331 start_codon:yes stop_codon:yes gene_type:complete
MKRVVVVFVLMIVIFSFSVSAIRQGNGVCEIGEACTSVDCEPDFPNVCGSDLYCKQDSWCDEVDYTPEFFLSGIPDCFVPTVGYVHNTNSETEIISLWGEDGSAFLSPAGEDGFRLYDKSEKLKQGFPLDFAPNLGYTHYTKTGRLPALSLWEGETIYFINQGDPGLTQFTEGSDWGIPTGFAAIVGFSHDLDPAGNSIMLINAIGEILVWNIAEQTFELVDPISKGTTMNLPGFNPVVGYTYHNPGGEIIELWDAEGNVKVSNGFNVPAGVPTFAPGYRINLPESFKPMVGYRSNLDPNMEVVALWNSEGESYFREENQPTYSNAFPLSTSKESVGLPKNFKPVTGWVNAVKPSIVLRNAENDIYITAYNNGGFRRFDNFEKASVNLPSDGEFQPILGYSTTLNGAENELISLWDAQGNAKIIAKGDTEFRDYTEKADQGLGGFIPIAGYSHMVDPAREILSLWDASGNAKVWDPDGGDGAGVFIDYDPVEREAQGLGDFDIILGYAQKLSQGGELLNVWNDGGDKKNYGPNPDPPFFRDFTNDAKDDFGIPRSFKGTEGYYSAKYDKTFIWDSTEVSGKLLVWNLIAPNGEGSQGKFELAQNDWVCTYQGPSCSGFKDNRDGCNSKGINEDHTTFERELLESIESYNENFAEANDLDLDFCSNTAEQEGSLDIECYCQWVGDANFGDCNPVVSFESNSCTTLNVVLEDPILNCEEEDDEYFLTWDSEGVGCVGGSRAFQCPSVVKLPFFGLFNLIISLMVVFVIYGLVLIDRKK